MIQALQGTGAAEIFVHRGRFDVFRERFLPHAYEIGCTTLVRTAERPRIVLSVMFRNLRKA